MNKSFHNDLLSGLNPMQRQAASFTNGAMLVLAGPGSGKTHVITKRIQYLIEECNIGADKILVITFTRAAAKEMQTRSIKNCSSASQTVFGTFHSIFYFILKQSLKFKQFRLMTDRQKYQILNRIIANVIGSSMLTIQMDMAKSVETIRIEFEKWMGYQKNNGNCFFDGNNITLKVHENEKERDESIYDEIFRLYETECMYEKMMDFDDILLFCKYLLEDNMIERAKWQNRFEYILVDEFQDINEIQYQILKLLAGEKQNLFTVGDDDQAIYSFRGSKPEFVRRFMEDYNAKKCIMDLNYRCNEDIVNYSVHFINQNQNRIKKQLRSAYSVSAKANQSKYCHLSSVHMRGFEVHDEQKVFVQQIIQECIQKNDTIAILLRTNQQVKRWEKELERIRHFEQKHDDQTPLLLWNQEYIKDVVAVLRFVNNGGNRKDFFRFMNKPERLIMREYVDASVDLNHILQRFSKDSEVYHHVHKLKRDLAFVKKLDPYGAICYILYQMGYWDYLVMDYSVKYHANDSVFVRNRLNEIKREFETFKEIAKPYRLFDDFLKMTDIEQERFKITKSEIEKGKKIETEEEYQNIAIMTYHGSKGLEFDCVILPEIDRGIVPNGRYLTNEQMEEERRMFYVAMTRAKNKLYITYHKDKAMKEEELSEFVRTLKDFPIR